MVKAKRTILFLFSLMTGIVAYGQVPEAPVCAPGGVTLSQKDVAERILRDGRRTREINLQYQQTRLTLATSLQPYDWHLLAETGYKTDQSVGLTQSAFDKKENKTTSFSLGKLLPTGTNVTIGYNRNSFQGETNALYTPAAGLTLGTADYAYLLVNQDIWANFFGKANRAAIDAAELNYKAVTLLRTKDLENLVMSTIRLYWTTYVSERNFNEKIVSRDRSRKLVDAVRRKSGFGYANPGEFAQAQADYEARAQDVKTASNVYLANLDQLNTALGLPSNCEVKFQVSDVIPPVPKLPEKPVESLRTLRSEQLRSQALVRSYEAAKSLDAPTLQLVGQAYTYGADRDANGAFSDLSSGAHPAYYAGVKFEYYFGSNIYGERRLAGRFAKEAEDVLLSRVTQESQNVQVEAERNVQVAYAGVLSAIEQKKYREKALSEMNRSFNQGRTEISIYIDAMNKLSDAEIKYSQSIGDYQTALNEWASVRDELIPEAQEEK
jgi:outer membrane protein TolC